MGRGHAAGTVLCVPTSAEVGAWVCSALLAGVPGGSAVQAERVQGPLLLAGIAHSPAQQPLRAGCTAAKTQPPGSARLLACAGWRANRVHASQ